MGWWSASTGHAAGAEGLGLLDDRVADGVAGGVDDGVDVGDGAGCSLRPFGSLFKAEVL